MTAGHAPAFSFRTLRTTQQELFRTAGVLVLSVLALTACDDDDATGVDTADLAGMWNATEFAYTDDTGRTFPNSSEPLSIDAIDVGGTVTLDVESDGQFTGTINIPTLTDGDQAIGGTITVLTADSLAIEFDQPTLELGLFDSFEAEFTLGADVLTFINRDTSFDFVLLEQQLGLANEGEVAAILTVTLQR